MDKAGFRAITFVLLVCCLPALSYGVIEEKSSIIGTLLDQSNVPLKGITIRLLDSFFLDEIARVKTDQNGRFMLSNLLPGLYLISVESTELPRLLKRIQVTSDSPTFIDIRPILDEDQLKEHSAWDKLKWTIRVAERNPLRDEESSLLQQAEAPDFTQGLLSFFRENIDGEISYLNVGGAPDTFYLSHAQVEVQGQIEQNGGWSIHGNVVDGQTSSYSASGDFNYRFASGHKIEAVFAANDLLFSSYPELLHERHISRFMQNVPTEEADQTKLWVTSVDVADQWQLFRQLRIDYGTRFDYYGYMSDSVSYSPRLQVSYQLAPAVSVWGVYYRNQSAPGNYYLHSDVIHPYIHNLAFLPYGGNLTPEVATGYESGVDFSASNFDVSVSYHHESTNNKIATVEIDGSPVNEQLRTLRPFVIFNANDFDSRGIQVQVTKKITPAIKAVGRYNLSQATPIFIVEKRLFSDRKLFIRNGRSMEEFHDLHAGVEASIADTKTEIYADWKWSSGSPLVFGRQEEALTAVDLEVQQAIPVHVFDDAQVRLLLAVRNLLDQNDRATSNADFQRALLYGMPRMFAGGVLVRF